MRASPPCLWILVSLLALAACGSSTATPPAVPPAAPPTTPPPGPAPAAPPASGSEFGFYVLSMTWEPNRCCTERDRQSCAQLPGSFAASHLVLHGLWPNFTDEQSRGKPHAWPQYCGGFAHCEKTEDASCAPGAAVPDELARLAPGYVAGTGGFATHEWSKHGSCTQLPAAEYFRAELAAIHSIPGDATPDALHAAVGADLARDALQHAFGVPAESVMLGCDAHCRLARVGFCLAKDAGDHPTMPIPCTANVATTEYDNGCVTRGCQRVAIQAAGACNAR